MPTLLTVTPSFPNTITDNTAFIMAFIDTLSPLAQSTAFEVGETFGISASVDDDDTCSGSDNVFIKEHDLDATLVGRSYVDVVILFLSVLIWLIIYPPTTLIMLTFSVHYPPLCLSIVICYLLIIMICLRGMWLTV